MHPTRSVTRMKQEGSAFVISVLVLFILSVLGIALMLTTTTEKDIAVNYRWGEQAFFNADAALEYGKNILAAYLVENDDFAAILPPPRPDVTVSSSAAPWGDALPESTCNPSSPGCRDYQYYADRCPPDGTDCVRVYIGRVLPRLDGTLAQYDFRQPDGAIPGDLNGDGTAELEGTTTLWVRRPIVGRQDYGMPSDGLAAGLHDRAILTAEGTAPGAMGVGAGRPVSVRRLEMTVRRPGTGIEGDEYADTSRASSADERRHTYDQVRSDGLGSN